MKNTLKQLEGLAINFKNDYFLKARWKLSAYYAVAMFLVVLIFSLATYNLFIKSISDNFEYDGLDNDESIAIENQLIDQAKDRLQNILILIDGLTIIITIAGGYYLAGRTLEPIKKTYAKQKKFVADSAHELRTPLAVMKTGAEAALSGRSGKDDYEKLIREQLEEIDFMSVMVNDLLFLAQSDNSKKKEYEKINLSQIIRKQMELMTDYAKQKDVFLKCNFTEEYFINGSAPDIKRFLANLIKNAIDYNKPDGSVEIKLIENKKQIILKIIDTGVGISKENLLHIFDRFYKIDQSRSRNYSGSGLGLAIVKEVADEHHGKIKIESQIGQGTQISITFPAV
jgi:signal transduction histidine kinase